MEDEKSVDSQSEVFLDAGLLFRSPCFFSNINTIGSTDFRLGRLGCCLWRCRCPFKSQDIWMSFVSIDILARRHGVIWSVGLKFKIKSLAPENLDRKKWEKLSSWTRDFWRQDRVIFVMMEPSVPAQVTATVNLASNQTTQNPTSRESNLCLYFHRCWLYEQWNVPIFRIKSVVNQIVTIEIKRRNSTKRTNSWKVIFLVFSWMIFSPRVARLDTIERENRDLKKSLYELSFRYDHLSNQMPKPPRPFSIDNIVTDTNEGPTSELFCLLFYM